MVIFFYLHVSFFSVFCERPAPPENGFYNPVSGFDFIQLPGGILHLDVEVDLLWLDHLLLFAKMMGHGMQVLPHVRVLMVNFTKVVLVNRELMNTDMH